MKRVLVAAMLLLGTVSVFATEGKMDREKGKQEVKYEKTVDKSSADVLEEECTISLEGWIGIPYIGIHVSCSAKAATCKRAAEMVVNCVRDTIKAVEEVCALED